MLFNCQDPSTLVFHENNVKTKTRFSVRRGENNNAGRHALMIATMHCHYDVVRELLTSGAHVNLSNNAGWAAAMIVTMHGHYDVVQVLIKHGATVNQVSNERSHGKTPLHIASENGYNDVVLVLVENGADVDQANIYNDTPLQVVSENGHNDVVLPIIEHGVEAANLTCSLQEPPITSPVRNL